MKPPRLVHEAPLNDGLRRQGRTLGQRVKTDLDRLRFRARTTNYTPEYEAWLKRRAGKTEGRNP